MSASPYCDMAQQVSNPKKLCCSICLDLINDPDQRELYSCLQCRQIFRLRPVLMKNTMLADLVEELRKTGLQAAPTDHCYAGPEDVACDFCTGRKLSPVCSVLSLNCELHLQPHYESPAFEKHKLVQPSTKIQKHICSCHDEVMKIFCCTDQQCICYLCSMDKHKSHDTVSAAAERDKRQRQLIVTQREIQQRIESRAISHSADKAVKNSEETFNELISLVEQESSDVKQQIRSQQKAEVSRVNELLEKLEQEISELRRKDAELERLSHSEDHIQFLLSCPSLSILSDSLELPSINIRPLRYFEDVTVAVSEVRDKLEDVLKEERIKISQRVTDVDVLLPQTEPRTRGQFLRYLHEITLDAKTANTRLLLSEGHKKATVTLEDQVDSSGPERFPEFYQVMNRESLTGRCYWEVEMCGLQVSVAIAYKNISRTGDGSLFGNNDKSWALACFKKSYEFRHNKISTSIPGPEPARVGVYLDHRAGVLCFYSISETMTLLHRVQTTFTQLLYAGLWLIGSGATAELCKLS
uniref:B30.2/SPRY domain-containing protein n=1 Tax=Monopterus albus TaxID=43700 RepID=A0A3Q3IAQ8_MONAL